MMILSSVKPKKRYTFSLNSAAYQTMTRSVEYKWPESARMGADPLIQFVGKNSESIELQGVVYPHYKGGLLQVDKMRESADLGVLFQLTRYNGEVLGKFAIESIEENSSIFIKGGSPKKIEFTLKLKRQGE